GGCAREVGAGRRAPGTTAGAGPAGAGQDELEDLYRQSLQDLEEGEVVRGRIVAVKDADVLVDVGYKSEGTIPLEEFQRTGIVPKVGEEIEVYLEMKEDSEGLIVLS